MSAGAGSECSQSGAITGMLSFSGVRWALPWEGLAAVPPSERVGERRGVAARSSAHVGQRAMGLQPGRQQVQEAVLPVGRGGRKAASALVPESGVVEGERLCLASLHQLLPVLRPIGAEEGIQGSKVTYSQGFGGYPRPVHRFVYSRGALIHYLVVQAPCARRMRRL